VQRISTAAVFVMIGAEPCTDFVGSMLAVDEAGFVLCGSAARERGWSYASREPYLLETVRPGVFVAGDVRSESTKRVAGAVGDGALAVRFVHQVLAGLTADGRRPGELRQFGLFSSRGPRSRSVIAPLERCGEPDPRSSDHPPVGVGAVAGAVEL
jgi:hypothetical protein